MDYQILIIFDTNISDTTGDQIAGQFSTALIICFCHSAASSVKIVCSKNYENPL